MVMVKVSVWVRFGVRISVGVNIRIAVIFSIRPTCFS
jgi:hypothetical protein